MEFPAAHSLNILDCDDDEECKPITECKNELKHFIERDLQLLKFCGIWKKSVTEPNAHCNKLNLFINI